VWASRPKRAFSLARDVDLLLSIFPFERAWYAERTPELDVRFVGHPMVDRYPDALSRVSVLPTHEPPRIVLLPGSRPAELRRHLPVMGQAVQLIRASRKAEFQIVVPSDHLMRVIQTIDSGLQGVEIRVGGLASVLEKVDLAIASTGTVTMECALFRVPTVAIYRTSWLTSQIARRLVTVRFLAMPNLLAGEEVFPEFIQAAATPERIAQAASNLLDNPGRRRLVGEHLIRIVDSLGQPGASKRAARAILGLMTAA
jgi:lipid-A-disaccharide synthase